MAAPNLFAPTTCLGSSSSVNPSSGATATDLVAAPAANHCYRVFHLACGNIDTVVHNVTISLVRATTQAGTYRAWGLLVPISPNSAYVPIGRDNPIFLQEGDKLQVTIDVANKIECVASYEDIS